MIPCTPAPAATNSDFTPRRCNSARRQASSPIAPPSMRCTWDISKSSVWPRDAVVSSRRSSVQSGPASAKLRIPRRRISPRSAVACTCSIANAGNMSRTFPGGLLRWLGDGGLIDCHLGLGERPSVHGRAGQQGDAGLAEKHSFEMRGRAQGRLAGDLPEDVLRLRAAAQRDGLTRRHDQVAAGLEDPDVARAARDRHVARNGHAAGPLVESWRERLTADVPAPELEVVGVATAGGVAIR